MSSAPSVIAKEEEEFFLTCIEFKEPYFHRKMSRMTDFTLYVSSIQVWVLTSCQIEEFILERKLLEMIDTILWQDTLLTLSSDGTYSNLIFKIVDQEQGTKNKLLKDSNLNRIYGKIKPIDCSVRF